MGVSVLVYVERKNKDTGKWELTTEEPVTTRFNYIFNNSTEEFPKLKWEDISDGLQKKFPRDEQSGADCAGFYSTTLDELEAGVAKTTSETFVRLNTIVKALGAQRFYRDDGEESWSDVPERKDGADLTIPVSIALMDDLQYAFQDLRDIGHREAFDVILSDHIGWDGEHRVVLVAC